MTHRASLELMQRIVSLEGSVDDQRVPGLLTPRSLFPEPTLYLEAVRQVSRGGAIKVDDIPWETLWTQWFSPLPWRHARLWRPLVGPPSTVSSIGPVPNLARRLYRRVQLSDALGILAHELSAHGFNPRWATDAASVMRALAVSRSTGILATTSEWAVRQVASAYLKGVSPFELQTLLKVSLAQNADLDLPKSTAPHRLSVVTAWMTESLGAVGLDYWASAPSAIIGSDRLWLGGKEIEIIRPVNASPTQ